MIMKFPLDDILTHLAKDSPDEFNMLLAIITNPNIEMCSGSQFIIAACTVAYNLGLNNEGLDRLFKVEAFRENLNHLGINGLDDLLKGMHGEHRDKVLTVISLFRCCFLYGCNNLSKRK